MNNDNREFTVRQAENGYVLETQGDSYIFPKRRALLIAVNDFLDQFQAHLQHRHGITQELVDE